MILGTLVSGGGRRGLSPRIRNTEMEEEGTHNQVNVRVSRRQEVWWPRVSVSVQGKSDRPGPSHGGSGVQGGFGTSPTLVSNLGRFRFRVGIPTETGDGTVRKDRWRTDRVGVPGRRGREEPFSSEVP